MEAVGFLESWQETFSLVDNPLIKSLAGNDSFDHVAVYTDKSGATFCLFETADGYPSESLTVNGPQRVSIRGWQFIPGVARLSVYDEQGEKLTNVLVWVDDPHMYPIYGLEADGPPAYYRDYSLGAIAVDATVFDSIEQWRSTQTPISTKNSPLHSMDENFPQEV